MADEVRINVKDWNELRRTLQQIMTRVEALETFKADLASTDSGKGASLVGINDTGTKYSSDNVEDALQELNVP